MAEYDLIAKEYQKSKQLPFRTAVESYSLFRWLGDFRTKTVLDLACGEGFHLRQIKAKGAARAVGVDISEKMIELGIEREAREPLGVEYLCYDVQSMPKIAEFDIVLGSYLLNYAKSKKELVGFLQAIARNLKPKGRFIGFNDNPANDPKFYDSYRQYGFVKKSPSPRKEGDPIRYHLWNEDGGEAEFDNFYLSVKTYEEAFKECGFTSFAWKPIEVDPIKLKAEPKHWDLMLAQPPFVGIELSLE